MKPRVFVYSTATLLSLFAFAQTASAQDVRITEFMASNPSPNTQPWAAATRDEDGEYSDWIEITNMELTGSVNLLNWGLTDNRSQPFQWRFPETNLNAGASIIVFASSKNRRVPGMPLHTDFGLRTAGEYLALVRPDGTIATEFDEYPGQVPNVSYGFGQLTTNRTLIGSNASVRVHVPTSGAIGMTWTNVTYDDSAWIVGTNGVGYGTTNVAQANYGASIAATAPIGHWRLSETSGTTAANIGSGAGLNGTYTLTTLGSAGPRPPDFNGFESTNNAPTFALTGPTTGSFVTVNNSLLSDRNSFTIGGWIRPTATQLNRTGLFGQNDAVEFGFINSTTLQCWTPSGGSLNVTYPFALNTWHHVVAVGDGTSIRIFLDGVQAGSGGSATANYGTSTFNFNIGGGGIFDTTTNFFTGQIDEVVLYQRALAVPEIQSLYQAGLTPAGASVVPFVKTDIGAAMSNINASAYIRFPFTVNDPLSIGLLTLRLRYDDGAAVFINGSEVLRLNGPEPLAFNSSATEAHMPIAMEEFRIGSSMLVTGANVLAIQGLNVAANDEDFLILADMVATVITASSSNALYFTRPTPGTANSGGVAVLGPSILETTHSPNVPKDNEDILVTAYVSQTFYPVTNVVLRYRVMFGSDVEVVMFDDGLHGDGAAGDGTYAATIPAGASTPSQMVRWFFRATDDRGNTSRWPLFTDPANSTEFLGTMVDYVVTSKLPVVHLFAPANILQPPPGPTGQVGADSQGGARVSLFFDGEFYDNVHMQLRGNTTAGFNKKSHRVEFNNDHPFRHSDAYPRVTKTSFVADYGDPAYMRQGLAFWLCNLIGSPTSFYEPMRLQLNGQFYQLANHSDVQDQDLLERLGFDPNGALYNAVGRATLPVQSTGGFEKKTRRLDPLGQADYNSVATRLAETNTLAVRRTNAYDIFDIPNAINYLVAARWSHENDDIWANLSLYHDNDGDDLWRIIAFDMNLSWGAIFFEGTAGPLIGVGIPGNVIGAFDAHKGHPLYGSQANPAVSGPSEPGGAGGSAFNRVYDVFFQNPDLRQMYLRRLRTMMDKYVKPAGLHPLLYPMETRVRQLYDMMNEEAERDRNAWQWPARGGQCNFDPGIRFTQGVNDLINYFIIPRRQHFYGTHSITNTAKVIGIGTNNNAGIPLSQPADATIMVAQVEYNPGSGNQLHEYLTVTNPNPYAVDISGWKLQGGVEFTFAEGTVLPSNGVAYVSPDVRAFKARPVAPRGGMGLFIIGPYKGQLSARGEPLMISNNNGTMVYSNVYVGGPSAVQSSLRITEIMYSPVQLAGNTNDAQEYEFIELKNTSSTDTLSLTGVRFTEGITFNFTGSAITSLAPGARVLVVKNLALFQARYGTGLPVAGVYAGSLDNGGDRIVLVDSTNEEIHDFDYENDWYPITDGGGFSLAIVNENADPGEWDNKTNWRPSGQEQGAPGQPETAPATFAPIIVNEVLTRTEFPALDTIELFNPTANEVNIGGWFLTDDFSDAKKYRIPDDTTIPAGGYLLFDEDDFNPEGLGFGLGADGDEAYLFSADGSSNLTGYVHGYAYGAAANNVSFGRHTNSVGDVHFVAQTANSLPGQNAGPSVGPMIISEFMYRPTDLPNGQDNENDEYIELQNVSGAPLQLFDSAFPENTWQLRGGVEFNFPPDITVPAGGFVLVANFDVTDSARLNAFRQKYNVPAEVPVFGPYEGRLANDADEIELKRPDNIQAFPDTIFVSIMVEQVDYSDEAPWPNSADGTGASLQRASSGSYANDPASWVAADPSAGRAYVAGQGPAITAQPTSRNAIALDSTTLSVTATGDPALRYQWRFNGANINGGTNAALVLENLQLDQSGLYNVTVYNDAGAVTSSNALINVVLGAYITAHPQPVAARLTSNVTFSVSVYSENPPVTYQWQFNGVNIPGATGPTHSINGVQEGDDGLYRVLITDGAGTITSQAARLTVLILPVPLAPVPPLNITAAAGETFTFSAQLRGTLPIYTRWRLIRNVGGQITLTPDQTNHQHLVTKTYTLRTNDSGRIALSITNQAGGSLGAATNIIFLTVLADTDGDLIPDAYENANGMDSGSAADANLDPDGDTMSNRAEYIAGTNPQDGASYLKVDRVDGGGPATVSFNAVSNRNYTVQASDTLSPPIWTKVGDLHPRSTNWPASVIDPESNPTRFYRLMTPMQP